MLKSFGYLEVEDKQLNDFLSVNVSQPSQAMRAQRKNDSENIHNALEPLCFNNDVWSVVLVPTGKSAPTSFFSSTV